MRNLIAIPVLALCFLAAAYSPVQSQMDGGDAFAAKASSLKIAMLNASDLDFMYGLAPWMRGRVNLVKAMMFFDMWEPEGDEADAADKEMEEWIKQRDPDGELGVRTLEDFKNLTAGKYQLWSMGIYVLRADEDAMARAGMEWFEVERDVYQHLDERNERLTMRGQVVFRNVMLDRVSVDAVLQGTEWHITNIAFDIAGHKGDMGEIISHWHKLDSRGNVQEAMRAEAESLAGSVRNQARVAYARSGRPPARLSEIQGFDEAHRTGTYYEIEDEIRNLGDEKAALVGVPIHERATGYLLFTFSFRTGESEAQWFDTREELDRRIQELRVR
jgi:hypothetical protein